MSWTAVLTDGTRTVDFTSATCNNLNVTHRFSNPFITLDTPAAATTTIGDNSVVINVGFVSNELDLDFMLHDGPGTFDGVTPGTTNYEKILYMANLVKNPKTLTLNGTAFKGHIINHNFPWQSGKCLLAIHATISFKISKDIAME